jgi:hypothetical protein
VADGASGVPGRPARLWRPLPGRVAQWESARFTRERSLVRNQPRPWLDGAVSGPLGPAGAVSGIRCLPDLSNASDRRMYRLCIATSTGHCTTLASRIVPSSPSAVERRPFAGYRPRSARGSTFSIAVSRRISAGCPLSRVISSTSPAGAPSVPRKRDRVVERVGHAWWTPTSLPAHRRGPCALIP